MSDLTVDEAAVRPDLAACANEPIHIPGAIQPHGAMLVLDSSTLIIRQASANCGSMIGRDADRLLSQPVDVVIPRAILEARGMEDDSNSVVTMNLQIGGREFDALVHRSGDSLIVELEPIDRRDDVGAFYREVQKAIVAVQATESMQEIYDAAAKAVARLSGFERVMIYKFDPEWNGQVVAESLKGDADSYLGQHFPSTDIPAQARELYRRNWLRIIPNSQYRPVNLMRADDSPGDPLDLSNSVLRSVSPVHLEYLQNMGVAASMSVSIMRGDQLWGLIACHHGKPRGLPYHVRAACEMLGQIISSVIASREEKDRIRAMLDAQRVQTQFFDHLAKEENVLDALTRYTPRLLDLVGASGAALCLNDQIVLVGTTPDEERVRAILQWVRTKDKEGPIFATESLSRLYPEAEENVREASGLLAISLSREGRNYILWFRAEEQATINWAGNPNKAAMQVGMRVHPRRSFEIWQQRITGRSVPWREVDKQAAQELRNAINALILRRTDRLLRLNSELERKNVDLNSFAHIASHDLQEPLRGLRELSAFLLEDYGSQLDEEGRKKLESLGGLAQHMHDLIEALQHFSRVGRIEVQRRDVDLASLIAEARQAAGSKLEGVHLQVSPDLPRLSCDPVLVREVFVNLMTNAVKYNDKPDKEIEIGIRGGANGEPPILFVRDNGIGIRDKHFADIFKIFRRLHPQERFGGGTGVGLAVCKAIIERHGGKIWCESQFGAGTTFCFTLAR